MQKRVYPSRRELAWRSTRVTLWAEVVGAVAGSFGSVRLRPGGEVVTDALWALGGGISGAFVVFVAHFAMEYWRSGTRLEFMRLEKQYEEARQRNARLEARLAESDERVADMRTELRKQADEDELADLLEVANRLKATGPQNTPEGIAQFAKELVDWTRQAKSILSPTEWAIFNGSYSLLESALHYSGVPKDAGDLLKDLTIRRTRLTEIIKSRGT